MFKKSNKYHIEVDYEIPKKIEWYFAPFFAAFWLILYLAIVVTQIDRLPTPLTLKDENKQPNAFIGERAQRLLLNLTSLGPRVVGSDANENRTVAFFRQAVADIQAQAHESFVFELDVQVAETGGYVHWELLNMYHAIQNVVVKLSTKSTSSESYLLMNSHYDSVPGSLGAGDDGAMVVVMLEVMRVLTKTANQLTHPIVFLFNGAEENPLQASHAFITQHKWAKNCKALINLDAAGSGGREILFQSGPGHPWLMKYYRNVPHPFATTMAEEVFQAGLIPSDTDFRIFRDYGGVPGLDMAYIFNGYVYHTEFDNIQSLPKGCLQNTGDNVLYLAKALANAPELEDPELHKEGHVIFYDFLGWFLIFYTQTTGTIINSVVSGIALTAIVISLYFMSVRSGVSWQRVYKRFGISLIIQIISIGLGYGLCMLVALFMDGVGKSMTWFSQTWLIIGLYFCPMFFAMGILPALYVEKTKTDDLSLGFRIQLFMHAHCLCLILITITLTAMGIRSSFVCMIAIFFDIIALIINLITKWHRKAYWFAIAVMICQVLPFVYLSAAALALYMSSVPMTGRAGSESNPEITIANAAVFMSILIAGFLMPLFMFFRKSVTIVSCFFGITLLSIILAVTPIGFPYTSKTATQRFSLIHAQRILHAVNGSERINESGIYVYPQDRRIDRADEYIESLGEKHKVSEYCDDEMFCGMPLYNHRWHKARERSYWIPIEEQPIIPGERAVLTLKTVEILENTKQKHYEFELSGPDHMTIFIEPLEHVKIINWSFNDTMLRENWQPPYFIYYSYGIDSTPLQFSIDVERSTESTDADTPDLEIGIGSHWIHQQKQRTNKYEQFVKSFPDYSSVNDWIATYENWYF